MARARMATMVSCSSEPDAWTCIDCKNDFTNPNVRVMECDRCSHHFCTKCLKMPAEVYDYMSQFFVFWCGLNCTVHKKATIKRDKKTKPTTLKDPEEHP